MVKMSKKKMVLEELGNCLGLRSTACKNCGISRTTFYNWFNNDPVFKQAVIDVDERMKDCVEAELYKLIKQGNPAAVIYYCKTKLRDRGYGENVETVITGGGAPPVFVFDYRLHNGSSVSDVVGIVGDHQPVAMKGVERPATVEYGFEEPLMTKDELPVLENEIMSKNMVEITPEAIPEGMVKCVYCGKVHDINGTCLEKIRQLGHSPV